MTAPSPKPSIPASDAIRFEHVSVRFGGVRALDDVSFSVGRGEVHCLAGENGSGKSTLIKVIAGVYQAAPGARTDYFGESVAAPTPQLARSQGRGGDLAGPGALPGNDGRREHRVRWPRGRAAARELPRHTRDRARRARQARRGARPERAAEKFADFGQTIGGDRTRARERREAHLHGRAHRLAHTGRDGPLARRRAHAFRLRRRRGFREPSAGGSARRVEPRHRPARRSVGRRIRRRGHDPVAVDGIDDGQAVRPGRHRPRRRRCADRRRNLRPDAPRRVRGRQSDLARRRGPRSHRLDRRRPHRTRAYAVRHGARRRWLGPLVRLSRRLREQSRSHRRGNRLRLRGSSRAGSGAAAIHRRQHRDHDPEGDLRAPAD